MPLATHPSPSASTTAVVPPDLTDPALHRARLDADEAWRVEYYHVFPRSGLCIWTDPASRGAKGSALRAAADRYDVLTKEHLRRFDARGRRTTTTPSI